MEGKTFFKRQLCCNTNPFTTADDALTVVLQVEENIFREACAAAMSAVGSDKCQTQFQLSSLHSFLDCLLLLKTALLLENRYTMRGTQLKAKCFCGMCVRRLFYSLCVFVCVNL